VPMGLGQSVLAVAALWAGVVVCMLVSVGAGGECATDPRL
jgi:hypothetical protein